VALHSGLAFVISATPTSRRLVRAAYVFARPRACSASSIELVPPPGQLALRLAADHRGGPANKSRSAALAAPLTPGSEPAYTPSSDSFSHPGPRGRRRHGARPRSLQDGCRRFSQSEAEAVIATSLNALLGAGLCEPGAAVAGRPIAQVHRGEGRALTGAQIGCVKVLRPNVAARFRRDLADFFFVAHNAKAHFRRRAPAAG